MSISRITNGYMVDRAVSFLNTNLSLLTKIHEKVATGRNINNPSDDPIGLTRILDLSNALRIDERYGKNIDMATAEINTAESAFSGMTDLIQKAKELAIQGANGTNNQTQLDAIADEVDGVINQLVQLGNTNIAGKYIFGGVRTTTPPFSRTNDDITYIGTLAADGGQRPVEIAPGMTVDMNVNGEALLGQVTVTVPNPVPPVFGAGSNGLLQTLVELKLDLQAGNTGEVRARLDQIDAGLNNVLALRSRLGAVSNRLDMTKQRIEERKEVFTKQYAEIQDVDMAKMLSDLNFQESVFQSSLGVTGRVLQTTLLDYIR